MIFSFRHKRWIKRKTFYVSVRNRTLRWMNIYGYLWKNLSISTKCEICTSLKILAIFFINKKFSTFFCFFAFLEYHGTLRISLFSKLSAWENILTVIVRYPKLPNHSTMHTCVLSRSIFSVILTYPSRISRFLRFFLTGWTEKLPNWFRRLSQNFFDIIKYRITGNFYIAMFDSVSINLQFLQTSTLYSFRYLWHICLPYELVVSVFDFPSQLPTFTMFTFLIELISFDWPLNSAL